MTRIRKPARADLTRMLSLLAQEESALKNADMAGLIRIAPRKESLLVRLETVPYGPGTSDHELAARVCRAATRNARLFEAALRGLSDARKLIETTRGRSGDRTYARNGARCEVYPPAGTLEKRA
ncbi:MAG: hypothetical protein KDK01_17545 [Rhodobacteraceae bacterium]|jgi:hypothetical protein|nr:hypothetical protein [Paracoccaceae bacterium]